MQSSFWPKTFLTILCYVMGSFIGNAIEVGKYHCSYFDKDFVIDAQENINDEGLLIFIQVSGQNAKSFFSIEDGQLAELIESLNNLKTTYLEWCEIASENHIEDINRKFKIPFPKMSSCWVYRSKTYFGESFSPSFHFLAINPNSYIATFKRHFDDSNSSDHDDEMFWVFSCAEDFDSLISALDINQIQQQMGSNSQMTE